MRTKKELTIQKEWEAYLERVGLTEEKMHPTQLQETRRAFFGACGQMLITLRDEISLFSKDEAIEIMENMKSEVMNFWNKEANKLN